MVHCAGSGVGGGGSETGQDGDGAEESWDTEETVGLTEAWKFSLVSE